MIQEKLLQKRNEKREWFSNTHLKYFHDLLNDKFYDDVVFNKKENGYYVEIGVLDGWVHSQSIHFEHCKHWDGIIVEPTPQWLDNLKGNRFCNICTNPISDKRELIKFVVRDFLAYSHIEDLTQDYCPDEITDNLEVETITLFDLLEKYNAPTEVDFVAIDTEGYELRILTKFFEENDKYKINLISLEHSDYRQVNSFFENKPYLRISNPYLNFIKMDVNQMGTVRLRDDNKFYNAAGEEYLGSINDLRNINWEHYYVHFDFIKENPHLKKYILRHKDISETVV